MCLACPVDPDAITQHPHASQVDQEVVVEVSTHLSNSRCGPGMLAFACSLLIYCSCSRRLPPPAHNPGAGP